MSILLKPSDSSILEATNFLFSKEIYKHKDVTELAQILDRIKGENLIELSTLRAKLKRAEAVVEAVRKMRRSQFPESKAFGESAYLVPESDWIARDEALRAHDEAGPQAPKEEA